MPEMNGWQIGQTINDFITKEKLPKPLFVLMTGWGVSDELEEIEKAGVDLILQKPVEMKVLINEIDKALKDKRR